jgi:hypothetical protein
MRREAQYTNLMQYSSWLMSTFSTTGPFQLLTLVGFERNRSQSELFRTALGMTIASAGLFALMGLVIFAVSFPISKKRHSMVLRGIEQHRSGTDVVDPFTRKLLPPPMAYAQPIQDRYWCLYSFARWEQRMALRWLPKRPFTALRLLVSSLLVLWLSLLLMFVTLWWNFPDLYNVVGYAAVLSVTFAFYHVLRLRQVTKLKAFCKGNDEHGRTMMQQYIADKFFETYAVN